MAQIPKVNLKPKAWMMKLATSWLGYVSFCILIDLLCPFKHQIRNCIPKFHTSHDEKGPDTEFLSSFMYEEKLGDRRADQSLERSGCKTLEKSHGR